MRRAGLLMPVSVLPSSYGIGDFGSGSRELIDYMEESGFTIWQILPLNPLGYGNSPYQPYSSFAGDEIYIDLESLVSEGLLGEMPEPFQKTETRVHYDAVRAYKSQFLKEAFQSFVEDEAYRTFISQEWVYPYVVFLTLKKHNDMKCWNEWPKEQKEWIENPEEFDVSIYEEEIRYEMFVQYLFQKQWKEVKSYAKERKIKIMGDIPFYVGIDSLDVWMNQKEFLLEADGKPSFIAGVPPDYFCADGQRWGNPIYNWKRMQENGFTFWKKRFGYSTGLFDIIRIDHFRAFDTYWKIPSTCPTAVGGEWIEAPGYELFDTLLAEFPKAKIVAEDLGDMRPEVYELRDAYHFPGMKIIQFTFDPMEHNNSFADRKNMIVYTGTHDNETIKGWLSNQPEKVQMAVERTLYALGYQEKTMEKNFIHYTLDNLADTAILPVQDILELGNEGRLNTPGTLGSPNWEWRLADMNGLRKKLPFLKRVLKESGRQPGGVAPIRKKSNLRKLKKYLEQKIRKIS
ncbi:MAG: 4-alpha-glucanotransferase [Hespellia sp.]|nr:4-alpha-glucanotransferase [Hespellia sp.]